MNFGQASKEELALIIAGLRAIHVAGLEPKRERLLEKAEAALASRGYSVAA